MNGQLEQPKLDQLVRIVQATGAKVVLSTDWRRQAPLKKQLHAVLGRLGIEIIGATPMRAMFQPIRPQEITSWLMKSTRVSSWVAIDDRDLLHEMGGANLQGHFVRTHPATGLTSILADKAIRILQTPERGSPTPISPQPSSPSRAQEAGFDELDHLTTRTPKLGQNRAGAGSCTPPWTRTSDSYGAFNGTVSGNKTGLMLSATQPPSPMTRGATRATAFNGRPITHGGTRSVPPGEISSPTRHFSPASQRLGTTSIWSSGQQQRAGASGLNRSPSRDPPGGAGRWRGAEMGSPMRR